MLPTLRLLSIHLSAPNALLPDSPCKTSHLPQLPRALPSACLMQPSLVSSSLFGAPAALGFPLVSIWALFRSTSHRSTCLRGRSQQISVSPRLPPSTEESALHRPEMQQTLGERGDVVRGYQGGARRENTRVRKYTSSSHLYQYSKKCLCARGLSLSSSRRN